ncbi:MAG: alpha/beta hydrolase [Jiangellaceae bacterium]
MIRRAPLVLLAVATLAAACTSDEPEAGEGPTSAPAASATAGVDQALVPFYGQRVGWETCEQDYECATIEVPLDYDAPSGETIELALLRAPASGDDRIGSLFVNPGGPGGSGIDYAQSDVVSGDVRERFDIVGFDPRGVGESTPIDCLDDGALDEFVAVDGSPDDDAEVVELQEQAAALAEGCTTNSGDLLPHIGTADVARDLDVMRAVLGDDELYYLGKSYGTYIGALYAEQFPDRVGRLVLDGAIDPTLPGDEVALGQAEGFERTLSAYLAFCLESDDGCPLGESEREARATLENLLDVIDAGPLATDDESRPLTQALAILGIVLPLYLTPDQGYPVLSLSLEQALAGDGTALLTLADIYLFRNADGSYDGNQNEAIYAVNCVDKPDVASVAEVEAGLPVFQETSPIFGSFLGWGGLACADWPAPATAELVAVTAAGAEPILVVGTTGDPATPYEWAESLASQLESGVLLTFEGTGHTAYLSGSDCIDEAVDAYLLEGEAPEEGTRCS